MRKFVVTILLVVFFIEGFSQEISSTAKENVQILKTEFILDEISEKPLKIWLYLPPNYTSTKKKFPVIYMHDAQNLFDSKTSYAGEWEIDETLNNLFYETKKGFVVVGIENAGEHRIKQYTPWLHAKYGGGKGEVYSNFLVTKLKPFIDANYRTKTNPKHTAIIGSSLGGLISYYTGLKHANVFGKIGALSTSFWFSEAVYDFTEKYGKNNYCKMYLLVGGKEGEEMVPDTKKIEIELLKAGFNKHNLKTKINPNGAHNEAFWKNEIRGVITWLFNIKN